MRSALVLTTAAVVLVLAVVIFLAYDGRPESGNLTSGGSIFSANTTPGSCIGPGTTTTILNQTQTTITTCSITQVVLDAQGCYAFTDGAQVCVQNAPSGSVSRIYDNGTIITTYPDNRAVSCNYASGQGPCSMGVP